MNQTGAGSLKTSVKSLERLQSTELGQGNGLLDVLAGDLAGGGLLQSVDDVLAGSANLLGLAGKGDSEEASVGVGVVLGGDVELGEVLGGLGQKGEARSPLDGGLAAQQGSQDGSLGLEASGTKGAGSGEGNHNSVAGLGGNALLTTEILGGNGGLDLVLAGGGTGGEILEELANPLGDIGRVGASSDESDVGLGVGILGELSQSITGDVLLIRGALGRSLGGAQAAVEGNAVSGIDGNVLGVGEDGLLLVLEQIADNLLQFVVCI